MAPPQAPAQLQEHINRMANLDERIGQAFSGLRSELEAHATATSQKLDDLRDQIQRLRVSQHNFREELLPKQDASFKAMKDELTEIGEAMATESQQATLQTKVDTLETKMRSMRETIHFLGEQLQWGDCEDTLEGLHEKAYLEQHYQIMTAVPDSEVRAAAPSSDAPHPHRLRRIPGDGCMGTQRPGGEKHSVDKSTETSATEQLAKTLADSENLTSQAHLSTEQPCKGPKDTPSAATSDASIGTEVKHLGDEARRRAKPTPTATASSPGSVGAPVHEAPGQRPSNPKPSVKQDNVEVIAEEIPDVAAAPPGTDNTRKDTQT